jgi:hypothetical protein
MKYRHHRGSLDESMATVVELPPTRAALIAYLQEDAKTWGLTDSMLEMFTPENLRVAFYHKDYRINWDCHVVVIYRYGVCGFTDQMPES